MKHSRLVPIGSLCLGMCAISGCQTAGRVASRPTVPQATIAESVEDRQSKTSDDPATDKETAADRSSSLAGSKEASSTQADLAQPTAAREDVLQTSYFDDPASDAGVVPPQAAESAESLEPIAELMGSNALIADGLTLEQVEQMAMQNNPAIAQSSASASKAMGFRNQVGLYPNPSVGYSGQQLDDAGTAQQMAFVAQDFVTAGKLKLNQKVLDQDVQSQLWEVQAQRFRVLTDVRQKFYTALAAQQRRDLANDFSQVLGEGVRVAELRRKALEGSVPEVLQTEIQLNEVDLIKMRAQFAYDAAWKELTAVAGVPGLPPQRLSGILRVSSDRRDWEATYRQLVQESPALQAARARISRSVANMDRQEVQAIPNLQTYLNVGYDYGAQHSLVNLQLGIPLPIFNQNGGNISAAQAEFCRATQEVRRLELLLQQQLAQAAQQYDSAAVTVERFEQQILPKAKQNLELSGKAYVAGEFDYLRVLVARRTFFDSNLQYNQALIELANAKWLIDGMLLDGGLGETTDTSAGDGLRGQTMSQQ